jgi:hypothetical protein
MYFDLFFPLKEDGATDCANYREGTAQVSWPVCAPNGCGG